ncbi:riboflavine-aldehyde-forming enzyme, partial [Laccaria bicolor S238N-H82]
EVIFFFNGLSAGLTNRPDMAFSNPGPPLGIGNHCFNSIGVHYKGKYVQATVVDKCMGCGPNDIDLSPSAFSVLAPESKGRIPVTWNYL